MLGCPSKSKKRFGWTPRLCRKTRVNKHSHGPEEILRRIKKAQCLPRGCRLWSRCVVPHSAHDAGFSVLRNSKLGDSLCRNCARSWFSDRDVSLLALRGHARGNCSLRRSRPFAAVAIERFVAP